MKNSNYSYISIAFILLVFGIIFIPKIVNRIKQGDITRTESRSKNLSLNEVTNTTPLSYLIINGEKKKVSSFSFINQNGKTITNEDYIGKVFLLEFFFTTCPTICPKMNQNLVSIQNSFPNQPDFGIASITINPNYDTVEVLKDYADQYGVKIQIGIF
jgi:protein SCO1/2